MKNISYTATHAWLDKDYRTLGMSILWQNQFVAHYLIHNWWKLAFSSNIAKKNLIYVKDILVGMLCCKCPSLSLAHYRIYHKLLSSSYLACLAHIFVLLQLWPDKNKHIEILGNRNGITVCIVTSQVGLVVVLQHFKWSSDG